MYLFINFISDEKTDVSTSNRLSTNLIDELHINFTGMILCIDGMTAHLIPVGSIKKKLSNHKVPGSHFIHTNGQYHHITNIAWKN